MYLEEFAVGARFEAGPIAVEQDEVIAFARRYDPQPFHTDAVAAKNSLFGGLAASGWMTASLTMRMLIESGHIPAGGMIARQVEKMEWPHPVRPGDTLRAISEVLEVIPSKSRPDRGMVRMRTETRNQSDRVVQSLTALLVVPRRAAATPAAADAADA